MSPYPRRFFSPTSNPCARCVDLPLCPAGAPLLPYHPPHAQGTDQQRCTRAIRAMDSTHHCSGRETHAARLLIPLECSPARLLAFEPAHPCPVFLPRHCILLLKRCASSPNRLVAPSRVVALPRLLGFDSCASWHFVSPCLHALPRGAVHVDFLLSVNFLAHFMLSHSHAVCTRALQPILNRSGMPFSYIRAMHLARFSGEHKPPDPERRIAVLEFA